MKNIFYESCQMKIFFFFFFGGNWLGSQQFFCELFPCGNKCFRGKIKENCFGNGPARGLLPNTLLTLSARRAGLLRNNAQGSFDSVPIF